MNDFFFFQMHFFVVTANFISFHFVLSLSKINMNQIKIFQTHHNTNDCITISYIKSIVHFGYGRVEVSHKLP